MALPFDSDASNQSRLDDYFTATIVGLPEELSLGKAFANRALKSDKFVTIDAVTAKSWISDPARSVLKQQLLRARINQGHPFPAGKFARTRKWSQSSAFVFALGFAACIVLLMIYAMQPWLRLPFLPIS